MASGTLTGLQHKSYNGGWKSWTAVGSASQYIGNATNHPYCLKFTVPNDNIIKAALTFSFNIVKGSTSTNSSGTISWDIRTAGPSTGVSKQGDSIANGTWSVSGITGSSQKKTFSTSRISSLTKGRTYYLWLTSNVLFQAYSGSSYYSGSIDYTNYTACTAPTSVTVTKTIVSPTGSFEIKWSGAEGGTNNKIVSYDVYLKVTSTGTAPTINNYDKKIWIDVTDNSTSGSTMINLSDLGISLTRGYKIVCGVVTRGWAGESYYSGIRIGKNPVRINDLPKQPTLNKSDQTIPSTSNGITVTATAGSDNYNTALKVYYSTSKDGDKNQCTSSITINPDSGKKLTYYFWTYDGLEYSSPKSITITKNIAPTISINDTETQVTTYNALGGTGKAGSQLGYAYAIRPNITTHKTGTVKITVEMAVASSDSDTNPISPYEYSYLLPNYSSTSTSAVNLNTYDIHTAAVSKISEATRNEYNIKWRLKFVLNDGIEDSKPVNYPSGGKFYTIAHAPSLRGSYNRFKNSDIGGTKSKQIWREVRMQFYNDTSTPIISVTAKANDTLLSATFNTFTSGNERYVDITLPDGIKGGSKVQITVLLTNSNNSITKKVSCTVTETAAPNMGPLTHAGTIIYPFTDTGTYQISMAWPFGNYTNIETALPEYNCSTNIDKAIQFVHASDTSGSNLVIKELKKQDQVTWKKNNNGVNDTITATLDGSTAYGWENELGQNELGYDTYAGQKTYYCQIRITNLFGKTYTSEPENGGWLSRIFDFNETAKNLQISSIQWATSNTDSTVWKNFNTVSETSDGNAAQEGMYLKFNLSFDLFTEEAITVQLKRKINNEESILRNKTYSKGELKYATNRTAKNNEVSLVYGPVGTISDATNRFWSFQITNARGTAKSNDIKMKVQRQTAPDINFTSCLVNYNSVNKKYELKYSFEQADNGGGSITNYLYSEGDLSGALTQSQGVIQFSKIDWDVKSICIKTISIVKPLSEGDNPTGPLIEVKKEHYSNYIIVYNLSPTVAYRKNQLGINTAQPDNESILTIYPTSNYKKILFTNGVNEKIELDLIKSYNNSSYPAITVKKGTTEYTLLFD